MRTSPLRPALLRMAYHHKSGMYPITLKFHPMPRTWLDRLMFRHPWQMTFCYHNGEAPVVETLYLGEPSDPSECARYFREWCSLYQDYSHE